MELACLLATSERWEGEGPGEEAVTVYLSTILVYQAYWDTGLGRVRSARARLSLA